MYKIQEETNLEVARECAALGQLHYEEVEDKASVMPYNVNYNTVDIMVKLGLIVIVTVRDEGHLVGYMINLVSEDFFTSQIEAKEVGIFLKKEVRGGKTFLKLLSFTQKLLLDRGVKIQYIMFKEGHDVGMAERLGYKKTETVYQKIFEV